MSTNVILAATHGKMMQFFVKLTKLIKAILRDLLIIAPSIYILLNKFSTTYINR